MFYPLTVLPLKKSIVHNLLLNGLYTVDSVKLAFCSNEISLIPGIGRTYKSEIKIAIEKWQQKKADKTLSWQQLVEIYIVFEGLPTEFRDELIEESVFSISSFLDFTLKKKDVIGRYYKDKLSLLKRNNVLSRLEQDDFVHFAEKRIHMFYKHIMSVEEFSAFFRYLANVLLNGIDLMSCEFCVNTPLRSLAKRFIVEKIHTKGAFAVGKFSFPQDLFDELQEDIKKDGKELVLYDKTYSFRNIRIVDWIQILPDKKKDMLLARVQGKTLALIAKEYGLCRERIRQICFKLFQNRPVLWEDQFLPLFINYNWDVDSFCHVTQEPSTTYYYLSMIASRGNGNMMDMMLDESISQDMKDRYLAYNKKEVISVGNQIATNKATAVFKAFVLEMGDAPVTISSFIKEYKVFIKEKGVIDNCIDVKGITARLFRLGISIFGPKNTFRRYAVNDVDVIALKEALNLDTYENETFSTKVLFDKYPEIMARFDIQHPYELHSLLKQRKKDLAIPSMGIGRRPILCFGNCSLKGQALAILKEHQELRLRELAKIYSEKYGMDAASFTANSLSFLRKYRVKNDKYCYKDSFLTEEEICNLNGVLTEDVYSFKDAVTLLSAKLLPGRDSTINADVFWQLGYYYRKQIVFKRKFKTIESALDSYFSQKNIRYFDPRVNNIAIGSYFRNKRKECALFHIDKNKVVNRNWLSCHGYTKAGIKDFIAAVDQYISKEAFTIFSLVNSGFQHKYLSGKKNYWLLASFLKSSGLFKFYTSKDNVIFHRTQKNPGAILLIEQILSREGYVPKRKMEELLKRNFDICVSNVNIGLSYKKLGIKRKGHNGKS